VALIFWYDQHGKIILKIHHLCLLDWFIILELSHILLSIPYFFSEYASFISLPLKKNLMHDYTITF